MESTNTAKPQYETIVDLNNPELNKPIVGQSMFVEDKPIHERISALQAQRKLENELLEKGGYDYSGQEQWGEMMQRLGRRR